MGGTTTHMMTLIYAYTLKWTLLAPANAVPLSWLYLNDWLKDYHLRIRLHWWIFVISILAVVVVQTLITLGRTWRTARKNPVESLRYE
jgi:putative ABC transport system permease protein